MSKKCLDAIEKEDAKIAAEKAMQKTIDAYKENE